ncbi:MAG: hypothetical protein JNK60_11215 [Acidobacteria bacterium]|nr:hypothetical protein [Acidobacteriota bacterium]
MSETVSGTYDGTVIKLDAPMNIDPNTRVRVTVEPVSSVPSRVPGFLETALRNQVVGPRDWATNIEGYLHGPLAGDD